MPVAVAAKPKDIRDYYAALDAYAEQGVTHEGALRSAFQNLLAETGRRAGWTLIPDLTIGSIRPDGTFRDEYFLNRGYWEAKDTDDNLEAEIQKKIDKGYPLTNIIFEDTRQACLYQNGQVAMRADLTKRVQLTNLLIAFFSYTEPAHEDFSSAVEDFKQRVPDLARGLVQIIQDAHATNASFQKAFKIFFELCRESLNPNLSGAAVDEMLVQHLLTERLIRTIFDSQDFIRRNVIAAEVETVIDALVSKAFNRHEFLKRLDPFYLAIESAARTITDFSEKQHFLNAVYERFFQGYSVKVADTLGIVYTPQEIVDFMCASVERVLKDEFGKQLSDPGVNILDPCTGTGNFVVNLLRRIPGRDLRRVYTEQLFANEVMLLPYYIAALNIEHAYYERTGEYESFEGLCFVDTLDLAQEEDKPSLPVMTEENTARVERQRTAPITVIIGNPPYNVGQINENDNNKNRKYKVIDKRIKVTYAKDSKATLNKQLYDPYVKFFRWAVERLEGRDGIVCFATNNSFVDKIAFDGMRKNILQDFTRIYHADLHGNVRENPNLSGTTHNVFGIQVGVGITVAIRKAQHTGCVLLYHRVPGDWRKEEKLSWLAEKQHVAAVEWRTLRPDDSHTWLIPAHAEKFKTFLSLGSKEARSGKDESGETIFKAYSLGVHTNSDAYVYGFSRPSLIDRAKNMAENFNAELDRWKRSGEPKDLVTFLKVDEAVLKWIRNTKRTLLRGNYVDFDLASIRPSLYRPFTKRSLFFNRAFNEDIYRFPSFFPNPVTEEENKVLIVGGYGRKGFAVLASDSISDLNFYADPAQCFPFYVYDEDGSNRRENITDWGLKQFHDHYGDTTLTKWDVFYYVYGLLHHPGYREKFADNLKRDLPRIPFAPDFRAFASAGKQLARLHLEYETLEPYELQWIESGDVPLSYRVERMKLSKDKTALVVNDSLTLAGIPPDVFAYRLGNRSALEWVIDQYRVKTDERSGIRSDPNRPDDEEYIVRLIGQVVRVSLETVNIVRALPEDMESLGLEGLSNDELLAVARTTVSPVHTRRLQDLLTTQRQRNLTDSEQQEATQLVEQEDLLTLRKSKALLLLKRRGALTGDLSGV